ESFGLGVADARNLPLGDDSVGAGVADLPYGRASLVDADSLDSLNREVLAEFHRVVRGRVVVVSDGYLVDEAREAGFDVLDVIEDRVHRSLTRHVHVLE
ncbi:MAG: hypothetical protein SV760_01340, partial [Halobacteria archaeon]|nr:hypothetical protein [Halobacteria archaeon]